jgi:hypothetical protein
MVDHGLDQLTASPSALRGQLSAVDEFVAKDHALRVHPVAHIREVTAQRSSFERCRLAEDAATQEPMAESGVSGARQLSPGTGKPMVHLAPCHAVALQAGF